MKAIEIPFGAKDSELKGWEYTIPEGMEAEIKDGKIVVREKESEDERIRKRLLWFLANYNGKWDYPETRIACRAWLEKQKENPKSADSIPSDCVSDAKCEYRWHKVGDSLPDNPREVLCKDEARNYFIGRYYVGEGWEISNYDDEDKPHHLNPPVSKWIDFPSEKQKEQKPVDYLDKDKVYAIMTKLTNLSYSQLIPINSDEFKKLHEITSDVRDLLDYPIEQKPAEWSEEDKQWLSEVYFAIDHSMYSEVERQAMKEYIDFLRSQSKPKQEWSEEDRKMIDHLIEALPMWANGRIAMLPSQAYEYVERLKSLRPQPKNKWSEEDESRLDHAITTLAENAKRGSAREDFEFIASLPSRFNLHPKQKWSDEDEKIIQSLILEVNKYVFFAGIEANKIVSFLKSLRPSWKPSEEQMNALNALNCHGTLSYVGQQNQLISLYNDLKKLKGGVAPMRDIDE